MNFQIRVILFSLIALLSNVAFAKNNPMAPPDLKPWKDYADHLRTCSVGQFTLINPLLMSQMQYQIVGLKDNKCFVIETMSSPDPQSSQSFTLNCSFEQKDLATIADESEKLATGNIELSSDSPTTKIMEKSCVAKSEMQTNSEGK